MMVGDSITEGQQNFNKYFPQVICNRGISGDTTMGVKLRLSSLLHEKPKKLFLLIGTNNLGWGTEESKEAIIPDILTITSAFQRQGTKVYVQSILPINTTFDIVKQRKQEDVINTNRLLAAYAVMLKTFNFVDMYAEFLDAQCQLSKEFTDDGLHLNEAGYKKWGEIITPYMRE